MTQLKNLSLPKSPKTVNSDSKRSLASVKQLYDGKTKSRGPLSFSFASTINQSRTYTSGSSTSKLMSVKSKTSTTTSKRSEKLTKSALSRIQKEAYSHLLQQKKRRRKHIFTVAIIHVIVIVIIIAIILLIVLVYWEQWKITHALNQTTEQSKITHPLNQTMEQGKITHPLLTVTRSELGKSLISYFRK